MRETSIDKSSVGFKERYSRKQKIKCHHKFGMKLWILCALSSNDAYNIMRITKVENEEKQNSME